MRNYIDGDNYGLMLCRQVKTGNFHHVIVHKHIVESSFLSNKTSEIGYSVPLYLYPESGGLDTAEQRRPNLNMEIVNRIAAGTGLHFTPEKETADTASVDHTFAPIDILDYIYAVLYSNTYRDTYAEFLKIDFPRVPYPENAEQFKRLAAFGATLRRLHLLEGVQPSNEYALFPVKGSNQVESCEFQVPSSKEQAELDSEKLATNNLQLETRIGRVYLNSTQYFDNIPQSIWDYRIGGYQPAQKWLKDRKGRALDIDEIEHYQKIITALKLTIDLQAQIDEAMG
jgi:predicted helicase